MVISSVIPDPALSTRQNSAQLFNAEGSDFEPLLTEAKKVDAADSD